MQGFVDEGAENCEAGRVEVSPQESGNYIEVVLVYYSYTALVWGEERLHKPPSHGIGAGEVKYVIV